MPPSQSAGGVETPGKKVSFGQRVQDKPNKAGSSPHPKGASLPGVSTPPALWPAHLFKTAC